MALSWITPGTPAGRGLVGGKGHHLLLLREWGMPVPRFGIVSTEAFRHWRAHGTLPPGLIERISSEVASWGCEFVAVRSSMTAEDSESSSYAGVMETYLYVRPEEAAEKIVECFRSADSERARAYRSAREGASGAGPGEAAVVVQEMIASETSGVAFSRAPVGNSALVYVEAGRGLGEGVVSGLVEVDKHWMDRFGAEVRREIARKERQVLYLPAARKTGVTDVPEPARDVPCLSEARLAELHRTLLEAEARLGRPADLEWAFAHGRLHVLQVRPITQAFAPLEFYADTNLSESYPGLTSPLTADFVKRMYTVVFTEAWKTLGESRRRLKLLAPHFERLIGEFAGHLYYRLNSYYVAVSSMPGGAKNLKDWHRMVGGGVSHGVDFEPLSPLRPWEMARVIWVNARLLWRRRAVFERFCLEAEERARLLDEALGACRDSRATARLMLDVILGRGDPRLNGTSGWGLTVINDLYVMLGLKFVTRLLEKHGIPSSEIASYLRTEAGVDSLEPLHRLSRIVADLRADAAFWNALGAAEGEEPLAALEARGFGEQVGRLREFLARFGDRSFEELKIECLTFRQDPAGFLRLVRFLGESGAASERGASAARAVVPMAGGWWFRKVANFAREAIQVRERTRLLRGRMYGWVREAMLQLARQAREEHTADVGAFGVRAFFSLRLAHLEEWASGRWDSARLARHLREEGEWDRERFEYPEHFCHPREEGVEPSFVTRARLASGSTGRGALTEGILRGTGAAPGVVRGEVLALTDPREALGVGDLSTRILVTRTTDPAWIFILSRCAGLISEKGSLLSHTAIVGRELGIPTVVGVPGAMRKLRTGTRVELDGATGEIRLMETPVSVE